MTNDRERIADMSSIPLPKASGIYQITCIPTGKIYVGSTSNIHRRWREHVCAARNDIHPNRHLQFAWGKHGADAFTISILELCDIQELNVREQYYLDTLKPYDDGFNVAPNAYSSHGVPRDPAIVERVAAFHRGRKRSATTRDRIAQARRGRKIDPARMQKIANLNRGKKRSPDAIEKTAAALRGKKRSPEVVAKMRARVVSDATRAKLRGRIVSLDTRARIAEAARGRKHTDAQRARQSERMRSFTHSAATKAKIGAAHRGRTLSPERRAKLSEVAKGRKDTPEQRAKKSAYQKGRPKSDSMKAKVREKTRQSQLGNRHRVICIATGESMIVHLPTFCEEHQLTYKTMLATISGRAKQHRGYRVERIPRESTTS